MCPSSHACSNSTYNTNNIVLETEGTTGTGLLAGRDILPNEIIAVFGNAIILQDRALVQEFTKLINTYNHPTRGFQYSIFYLVAGDSYPSVVIPDLDRKLAHGLPNLSKQLRSRLRNGSSMAGLAHLANHTCCPHHRNSELQILSVWQEDRTSATLQGPAGEGSGARNSTALGRTLVASLRGTDMTIPGNIFIVKQEEGLTEQAMETMKRAEGEDQPSSTPSRDEGDETMDADTWEQQPMQESGEDDEKGGDTDHHDEFNGDIESSV